MSFLYSVRLDPEFPNFWKYLNKHWNNLLHGQNVLETSSYGRSISLLQETPSEDVPKSADEAFDILVDTMILHFGSTPRDVIFALYNFHRHKELHAGALSIRLQDLENTVQEIIANRQFSQTTSSHRVVSINPIGEIGEDQTWEINFKSMHIKEQLSEQYITASENEVRSFVKKFSPIPQGRGLAGTLFEPLAHRAITRGVGSWSFYKMLESKGPDLDFIKFVYDPSATETDGFPKHSREQVKFLKRRLPEQLTNGQYYIPSEPNFPLIDSFLVDLDFTTNSAHLWVLQMTTSENHNGSKQGYVEIRKIIGIIGELFKKQDSDQAPPAKKLKGPGGKQIGSEGKPLIHIHYVLVCPDSQVQPGLEWQLPGGWNEGTAHADHRGDGYLLKFRV